MTVGSASRVVVVGAGPVGLATALGLARAGRDVLVLERNETTAEHSRAPAIWPGTQEILAELGVIDAFLDAGIVVGRLALRDVDRGSVLFSAPLDELEGRTPYPHLLILPQSRTERLLLAALEREPTAEVRFSCEVVAVVQRASTVEVRFRDPSGQLSTEGAEIVAGCDGARSTVRESIGAELAGITYRVRAALADLRIDGSSALPFPRLTTRPRIAIGIRIAEDLWRMILPYRDDDGLPLDRRVEDAAASLFGTRVWQPVWQSEFRLHRRVSTRFHEGRVVLAGDAAHLNSPVGGQGMNAGLQDAARLVAAIDQALDLGTSEPLADYARSRRREIQQGVNRFTDGLTRLLLAGGGRMIRPALRLANTAMRVAPLRRRILRRLAMLD